MYPQPILYGLQKQEVNSEKIFLDSFEEKIDQISIVRIGDNYSYRDYNRLHKGSWVYQGFKTIADNEQVEGNEISIENIFHVIEEYLYEIQVTDPESYVAYIDLEKNLICYFPAKKVV